MRRIEYVKVLVVVVGLMVAGSGVVWGAAGELLWTFETGGEINHSPAIGLEGDIYFGSRDGRFYALKPDGSLKWIYSFEEAIQYGKDTSCSPSIANDGTIYFDAHNRHLFALSQEGTFKWSHEIHGGIAFSTPAIGSNGNLYLGAYYHGLFSFGNDGSLKWEYSMKPDGVWFSSPVISSTGTIYVGSRDNYLYAFNSDGTIKWRYLTGDDVDSSLAIDDNGNIYFASKDGYLYALNSNGELLWKYSVGALSQYSAVVIDSVGNVYILNADNQLFSINSQGVLNWIKLFNSGFDTFSAPLIGSDNIIYLCTRDTLYALKQDSSINWQLSSGDDTFCNPTLDDNGIIYVGSKNGYLYAIDTGTNAGLADSPWPKFQCNNKNTGRKSEMYFAEIPGGTIDGVQVEPFQMGITEVTNKQYADYLNEALAEGTVTVSDNLVVYNHEPFTGLHLMYLAGSIDNENKCRIKYDGVSFYAETDYVNYPVVFVSWYGAKAYANHYGYDLPTKQEWKHSGQGGKSFTYATNDGTITSSNTNYDNAIGNPQNVGSYSANPYGLYEMAGNVWEWCSEFAISMGGAYNNTASNNNDYRWEGWSQLQGDIGFRVTYKNSDPVLLHPNGEEKIIAGKPLEIIWKAVTYNVKLEFSDDNGSNWINIEDEIKGTNGFYLWNAPQQDISNCLIKIINLNTNEFDISDESFQVFVDDDSYKVNDITFAAIPEGKFEMGVDSGYDNTPIHDVHLNSFYVSKTEITQKQFQSVMGYNPSHFTYSTELPVDQVSWSEAIQFCNNLSEQNGLQSCYDLSTYECDFSKNGFRLPTEAEWEYFARAGDSYQDVQAVDYTPRGWNYLNSYGTSHVVSQKIPNAWGVYDVQGNIFEFCNDRYGKEYYSNSPLLNPTGEEAGVDRSCRGGGMQDQGVIIPIQRGRITSLQGQSYDFGFRVVRRESRTIQGKILDDFGSPVQFASLQITGAVTDTTVVTDDAGTYTLAGWLGGDYTITPKKVGCTFSPASLTVSISFDDVTDANFTATVDEKYIIEQGITLAAIPAGSFEMGDSYASPVHTVKLTSFMIGIFEVTQGQYRYIRGSNPSGFKSGDNYPVESLQWYDAVKYCNRLSDSLGLDRCYDENSWSCDFNKNGFRLPTEAEWEYACRAGTETMYYTGNSESDLGRAGWNEGNSGRKTHIVGQKEPNLWGLYDMHGNVFEWCNDWFSDNYYSSSPTIDPPGPDPTGPQSGWRRVKRGGSNNSPINSRFCASAARLSFDPQGGGDDFGFRIVRRESRSIQGTVNLSGSPLQDTHLLITGAVMDTVVTTDDTGSFSLSGWLGGDYTITPRKVGYTFSPDTTYVSVGFEDVTVDTFEAEVDTRYVVEQGIHFAKIPAGSFEMGLDGYSNDYPVHDVSLDGLVMSATEITQDQYFSVSGIIPVQSFYNEYLPVQNVSWEEAVQFCNRISDSAGLERCYDEITWKCDFSKSGYRLPTESEWEYVFRANRSKEFYSSVSISYLVATSWIKSNSNMSLHHVGLKEPNPWGLFDMTGNVWEFCNDLYGNYSSSFVRNPVGVEEGNDITLRGGSYDDDLETIFYFYSRGAILPSVKADKFGFRIVRSLFTIEGTILDDTGNPVNGAEILIASADTDTTVTTDENGFYNLSGLEKGRYTLSPSIFGYGFAEPSYTVTTDARPQIADITALSYLTLTSPNGGEFWETGTEQQITWTSNFLSTIKIEYSDDGGSSWAILESSIDATLGTYAWSVPDLESTDCLIRVTDTIDANVTDKSNAVFTVTKPVFLILTSMNEGEELINLDTYQITWQSHRVDKIRIEYSPDNGGRWTSIETSVDAATGSYDWTVPDIVTSECLIRLTDTTDANMSAESEAVFTVIDPTFLTLLAPTGGEQLTQGSEYEIRWDFFRVSKIRIEYTPDGGTRWVTVSSSVVTADSLFVWTVPAVNSTECKIRITDLSDANFTDMSDVFGIVPPSELMVTSPKGGEQWTAGTTVPITWASAMLTKVTIEYSSDGGENWLPVAEALDASLGTFEWTVPDTPSATCLVRISDAEKPETTDRSDSAFTILPAPKVTVTSPNGGEQWAAMTIRDITYDALNVASVKIEYSTNSGADWTVVAETVDAATGSFAWTLPDLASDGCLVRITSTDDPAVTDASDTEFSILQIPAVVLLSPNGGENLITGTTFDIKWSSAYVNNVTVELSIDNGTTWITLADAKGGTLLLPWPVPDTYSDQCLIRVYDASNDEVVDSSDAVFAIVPPPTLAVTTPKAGDIWNAETQAVITWTSLSINTLRIEYSTDNGNNWTSIADTVNASTGSVTFDVPDLYSGQSIIRVTDADNGDTVALSETFTILPSPDVTIVSPNGGESFEFGSTQTIQWSATESVANILLEYSTDGGSVWKTLGSALNAADGSLSWDVPAVESAGCLIRVTDTNDANINDKSDEPFSITEAPYLVLVNPDGGETLTSGDSFDITWDAHRIPDIRIDYSPDGGTQWIKITDSVDGADGSLSWDVPDISSANCLIRIVDKQDANRKDISEAKFSIVPKPAITVTYPNGDETLNVGSLQAITWTSVSIQSVKIEYSLDDGSTWLPIIGSIPASDGSYNWSVPDFVSSSCRMRISDTGSTGITDTSDAVFSAIKTSFVQLKSPAGGESWLPGTDHTISWTGSGVSNIRIELSTDGGITWSDIVASINILLGSYTWTVSAIESTDCIVRISDVSDAGISDQNITAFAIASEKDSPISIESVMILDESGLYNTKTDTLDVVVTLSNLTDEAVSDISFVSTVDGSAVTPNYGALDADGDGDIDTIQASSDVVTVIGKVYLPSSSDSWTIAVTQVKADGDTYALSFEDDITIMYANRDDGGAPVAYDPAVDGYSFVNPPGWSWHAFKDELKALDTAFVTKSNAVFPFFSKFANWKGRSLGMAAASNIYFSEPSLKPVSDATYTMSLTDSDVSRDIMLYSLRTLFDYLEDDEQSYDDMSELISDAKTKLASGEPFILLLKKNQGKAVGKAVSVYKLIETATETIMVAYDCEYPDGTPQFITVSTIDNTLTADDTYDHVSIVNQETLSDDYAIGDEIFTPYTKKFVSNLWKDNKDFFGHASPARMLVTDPSTGNQVGFEDGTTLVNEITDSSVVEIPNEEEGTGYAFYVPHGPDYTVEFFGQETGTMYVDMIAPQSETNAAEVVFEEVEVQSGTIAVIEKIDLAAATPPSLQVDLNGDGTTDTTLEPTEAVTIVTEPVTTSITLLTPSGGERWTAGSDQSITWSSTGIVTVKLEYSVDDGIIWTAITSDIQASATTYIWTVPMTESSQYLVRISDAVDSSLMDVCNVAFEVFLPATTITHTPVTEATENQAITFSANITSDTELNDVMLYYDVSGRRTFDKTLTMDTSNDQDYSASLSQGSFTALGLEYYTVATDSDGNKTRDPLGTGYYSIQASLSEANSTYHVVGGSEVNSYRMISVPLELSHTSIGDQLQGRLPTGDSIYDWRIFEYVDDITGYKEYPEVNGLIPGKSIWIITQNESGYRLKTREGKSVTTSTPYQITLKPGWNLIADPWLFPISWTNIENPAGATLSELYSYEGNWSDPTNPPATLEPWKGYAVRNMEQYSAVVKFQPIQAGTTLKIATDSKPLWTVQIAASGGGATDTANYFGAHKSSSLTWDRNDHVEPPPIGQYVSVAFPHDDWEKYPADYTVDMRPPESVTDGWAFDVRTNLPGEEITISLLESETVPVDLDLAVIDLDTGEDISLFNGAFSFVSGDTPTDRHFAVTVGGAYKPGDDQSNVTPQEFVTARSFPNPFNPSTTISYELSHQTDVVISVYNTLGQMVRKYDLGTKAPGAHDLVFDTLGLTSGIYIYRVDAGYATATDKMMFMK